MMNHREEAPQSLKQRTVRGLSWAFIERAINQGIFFVIGIVLARLLSPREYGLIGMLAIFMAIADTFIIAGYGEALIRKKDPSPADYNTTLVANVSTGLLFYALFLLLAQPVSRFFNEPVLADIIVVMGLSMVVSSFALVARVPLVKQLDFKSLTKIATAATLIPGIVAIVLALKGYGVWSLVWRSVTASLIGTLAAYLIVRPRLRLAFSISSFRELFGFGSKLLLSRLFSELHHHIVYVVIGRYFSTRELGLYTRADGYKELPSRMLSNVVQSVSFPALAELKDDNERLRAAFRKVLQITMYATFILLFCLAGSAENFILGLIGPQWKDAIPYLQMLCFVGLFYPLHFLNLSILVLKGQSGLHLKIEVITRLLVVPAIIAGVLWGIKYMIVGLIITSAVDYAITAHWAGQPIRYGLRQQLADISPSFFLGAAVGLAVFLTGELFPAPPLAVLAIQGVVGLVAAVALSDTLNIQPYLLGKHIVLEQFNALKRTAPAPAKPVPSAGKMAPKAKAEGAARAVGSE